MNLAALHRIMSQILEEAAEEAIPVHGGAAPRPGGLYPVCLPPRVTVSVEHLDALCALAGWASLADALEDVGNVASVAPEPASVTIMY
jgi:hypothetical protein